MAHTLLRKAHLGGIELVKVTPDIAGWRYVGFQAFYFRFAQQEQTISASQNETCVVVLKGSLDMRTTSAEGEVHTFLHIGERPSVFADLPPAALYVPKNHQIQVKACTNDVEFAMCYADASTDNTKRFVTLLDSEGMQRSVRGVGNNTRYICDILPESSSLAAHLLVVEVRTPAGHSSSYPPHKHDIDRYPTETQLEEVYYHRLNPPQGFAFQRVYTDDRSLDEAFAVENHDAVMVPRGYHPVVVPYGYDSYYLNVMAGPLRKWAFKNDPQHEWMLQAAKK